ncbi:MAG: hypothetical protein Q7T33_04620 [Dehalococcoidia bacterium]|nr:hypothetical protein [Dehalococcoidia bacterium]
MDGTICVFLVDLPLLTLVLAVIGVIAWNRNGGAMSVLGRGIPMDMKFVGIAAMVVLWLLLSVASMCLAFLGGLVVFYVLLFWLGHVAASIGAVLILTFLASIPFFWGWALLRSGEQR